MAVSPHDGTAGKQGTQGQYYKHPAGTRWAYFPKLPPGYGRSKGWIRVGSPTYNRIHRYNVSAQQVRGQTALHPNKIVTAQWNPASPQGRQHFLNQVNHPAGGGHGGRDPGSSPGNRTPQRGVPGQGQPGHKATDKAVGQRARQVEGGGGRGGKGKGRVQAQNYGRVGQQIGSAKVGQMIPQSYADQLAGLQYDAQIHDLQTQLAHLPAQQAQNQADIGNWMQQVAGLNTQAGNRAQQMGQDLSHNQGNVTAQLMAALGGGANAANSMVAAQGGNQAALFAGLGSNAQQYSADMAPFIAMQEAGAKQAQMAAGTQQTSDYQRQLADAMGQRGQAKTNAILQIIDANNQLSQQRFANKLSKLQAQSGVASLMGDLALKSAQTNDTRAHTAAMMQQAGQANKKPLFQSYSPGDQAQIIQSAIAMNANGKPTRNRQQAMRVLKGYGFDPQNYRIQNIMAPYYGH